MARQPDYQALGEFLLSPAAILDGLPDAVVAAARDGRIVFVNALAEELFGFPREELLGQPVRILWPERVRERYTHNMQLYFATNHPLRFSAEALGLRKDGSEFVGEMSWGIVETSGEPLLLAIGRDVSDRRAAETRVRALAAIGERALAGADPSDLAAEALEVMRATLPIFGGEVRAVGGVALASSGPTTDAAVLLPIGQDHELLVALERELSDLEMNLVRALANILATALGRLRDEERMRHEAVHDPLTGLANRILLHDHLEQALARSEREGGATGVLFVDLDEFKQINDTYGHAAGDEVLTDLAERVRTAIRPADTVARFGGDEFVVVCEEVDEPSALVLARRVQETIRLPLTVGGIEHRLSASIGIAVGRADKDALLAQADTAAYRAKAAGRGGVELFHQPRRGAAVSKATPQRNETRHPSGALPEPAATAHE